MLPHIWTCSYFPLEDGNHILPGFEFYRLLTLILCLSQLCLLQLNAYIIVSKVKTKTKNPKTSRASQREIPRVGPNLVLLSAGKPIPGDKGLSSLLFSTWPAKIPALSTGGQTSFNCSLPTVSPIGSSHMEQNTKGTHLNISEEPFTQGTIGLFHLVNQ